MDEYEEEARKYWEENYGYDDDPDPTWEEFKENYTRCALCGHWDNTPCICYAR